MDNSTIQITVNYSIPVDLKCHPVHHGFSCPRGQPLALSRQSNIVEAGALLRKSSSLNCGSGWRRLALSSHSGDIDCGFELLAAFSHLSPGGCRLLGTALWVLLLTATGVFTYYYIQYGHMIDQRLTGQIYQNTAGVYSSPGHIFVGESLRPGDSRICCARVIRKPRLPGLPDNFMSMDPRWRFARPRRFLLPDGNALRVRFLRIGDLAHLANSRWGGLDSAEIEPEVITNLFDSSREKRRVMRYDEFPR